MRRILPILCLVIFSITSAQVVSDSSDTLSNPEVLKAKQHRSPMGALLRSVAVPGWGQFYNHSYIKSVVVFGGESFFIYKAIYWWKETEKQYDRVQQAVAENKFQQFDIYQNYRGRRNDFLWLVGLSAFLSMFDAYVDAHLSGFDIDITPEFEGDNTTAMLQLSLKF